MSRINIVVILQNKSTSTTGLIKPAKTQKRMNLQKFLIIINNNKFKIEQQHQLSVFQHSTKSCHSQYDAKQLNVEILV